MVESGRKKLQRILDEAFLCNCSCGHVLLYLNVFCMHCGRPNPSFSSSLFEAREGKPLIEFIKEECKQDHPAARVCDFSDWEGDHYCPYCGAKLDFIKSGNPDIKINNC